MIFRIPRLVEHVSSIMTLEVCRAAPLAACLLTAAHRRATSFSPGLLQVSAPLRLVTGSNVHWPSPAARFSISSPLQLPRETEVIYSSSSIHCILVLPPNKSHNYMPMVQSTTNAAGGICTTIQMVLACQTSQQQIVSSQPSVPFKGAMLVYFFQSGH